MTEKRKHFQRKDVGYDCEYQLEGENEDAMLHAIKAQAAEVHNLTHYKDEAVEHVK